MYLPARAPVLSGTCYAGYTRGKKCTNIKRVVRRGLGTPSELFSLSRYISFAVNFLSKMVKIKKISIFKQKVNKVSLF